MQTRPIWAEISRSRFVGNLERLRALAGNTSHGERCGLLAVVKADAYGHTTALCAPWLAAAGAEWLGVTSVAEGVAVRSLSPQARILVLRGIAPGEVDDLLNAALTPTVWDPLHFDLLAEAVNRRDLAPATVPVHLEIDTGMSRQGVSFAADQMAAALNSLGRIPALRLDGVFTHFASPEVLDAAQNQQQMERFRQAVEQVAAAGLHPQWLHAGNSATLLGRQMLEPLTALANRFDARFLARPGLALYGYVLPLVPADCATAEASVRLEPVLTWKARILAVRAVEAGTAVGYNATFVTPRSMRLALLPVGYADGLNRKLSNRGHVLVRGMPAAIVGRVSMDLTIVDVSAVPPVEPGEEVVIIGEQNGARVTAADHARWAETIPYEILCAISARVPRLACD